jgi:hypothetical protein
MSEIRYKDKYIQKLILLFLKENNISDNNYFNCDYLTIEKIILIMRFYYKYNKKINNFLNLIDLDENIGVLLELMYKTKFNINNLMIKTIKFFDIIIDKTENLIYFLEKIIVDELQTYIEEVVKDFIKDNDIHNFEKFIKILYSQYKPEILSLFEKLLQELIYHYDEKNIIFIKLIIDNISNKEFINILEEEKSFIFNLIVEYHYDIEFQKYIIDKNIPEDLLFNSIIDSIVYMGDEYLIEHSFNNEIKQTIINNIDNNNNLNILNVCQNYKDIIKNKIIELNIEFDNYYKILLYVYNKFNFDDKKDIIKKLDKNNFVNHLKFCCINTDNYIQFIDSENKEFNWRKKSPLLLVWYFEDKSKKRKFNEVKLTEIPFDMIREIISFI